MLQALVNLAFLTPRSSPDYQAIFLAHWRSQSNCNQSAANYLWFSDDESVSYSHLGKTIPLSILNHYDYFGSFAVLKTFRLKKSGDVQRASRSLQ